MATLTVGIGSTFQYHTIANAIAASHNGDTIAVKAGTYTNDTATISTSIHLEAVGGRVVMNETANLPNQKGILVVGTSVSAPTVTIDGFDFSGAKTPNGGNGAGIRYQNGNLTLTHDYFHNNQDGILATPTHAGTGSIWIDNSEFSFNGTGDGYTHNIYIGDIGSFTLKNSYSHDAAEGHEVKSRAENNTITNSRILDDNGTSSYSIDLPNGGNATISGNTIEQGAHSHNPVIIAYGEEGALHAGRTLQISENTIVNDLSSVTMIWNRGAGTAQLSNNHLFGIPSTKVLSGTGTQSGNTTLAARPALDTTTHPYTTPSTTPPVVTSPVVTPPATTPVVFSSPGLLHAQGGYFATANGKAVYLAGNHTWTNGLDYQNSGPFNFASYLNMLQTEGANLTRLWTWGETVGIHNNAGKVTSQLPFLRSTTPGEGDGGNRFDLTHFNQAYFDALLSHVQAAGAKGIYTSVMLFFDADPDGVYQNWKTDYWNGANNINGTTTSIIQVEQGTNAETLALQEAYVAKVLDTLHGQSNLLFEVANEPHNDLQTVAWENTIVNFVHSYEQQHGYDRHPVGITANYSSGSSAQITPNISTTNADWFSPSWQGYQSNPPAATGNKVVIVDTNHVFGIGGDFSWVWQQFTRGYNVLSMDDLRGTGVSGTLNLSLTAAQFAQETSARLGITETRQVAQMVDMTTMKPSNALASTGYALADDSKGDYVVFSPTGGHLTVNLSGAAGKSLAAQWMDVSTGKLSAATTVSGGSASQGFTSPYAKSVLILAPKAGGSVTPPPPVTTSPPEVTPPPVTTPPPVQTPPPATVPPAGAGQNLAVTFDPATHKAHITGSFVNKSPVLIYVAANGSPVGPGTGTGRTTIQPNSTGSFSTNLSANPTSSYTVEAIEGSAIARDMLRIGSGAVTFNIRQSDVAQDLLSGFRVGQDHFRVTGAGGSVYSSAQDKALIAGATSDAHGSAVLHLAANHAVTLGGVSTASLSTTIFA
jgi:hypothetical protein